MDFKTDFDWKLCRYDLCFLYTS